MPSLRMGPVRTLVEQPRRLDTKLRKPPPPNSGTLLHNASCASYALRAYCIRGSPCVPHQHKLFCAFWTLCVS